MSSIEDIVSGKGRFIDDITLKDMVHLAFYRSPYARALIRSVKAEITHRDIGASLASVGEGATDENMNLAHPTLASGSVMYVGQPIAAVYGRTKYEAEDKLDSVEVDFEPLKPIMDPRAAINGEPIIPGTKTNVLADTYLGKEFKVDADIVLEDRLENKRVATNPIETRGIVASYDGSILTVYTSTQSVHSIKEGIVESLGLQPDKVRVIQTDTGGAFGLKGGLYPEYIVACSLSMKLKKPVKWIESRSELLMASRPGRGVSADMKIHAMRDGRIMGVEGTILVDAGAYDGGSGGFSAGWIARQITGPYDIRNAYMHAMAVMTNKVQQGPYRGAGRPEAAFFMERMVDLLAEELKMDPVELRMKNLSEKPLKSPLGMQIEAAGPFFRRAVREMQYEKFKRKNAGVAFFVLVPALFGGESCRIHMERGKVKVWLGGDTHGQRHDLFVKSLVSKELDIPEKDIQHMLGDTAALEKGVGSWGSRSAIVGGNAIISACRKLKEEIVKKMGSYDPSMLSDITMDAEVYQDARGSLNSFGANLATAEVDDLGYIKVNDVYSCYDVGKALTPSVVVSQIEGGAIQGIGQVISERILYSEDGQLLTASIADAGVLNATQVPNVHVSLVENPSDFPHGAKGVGESPTIGVPAAVVSAVERVTHVRIRETPVTPETFLGRNGR